MTNTITILAIAIVGLGIPSAYACAPEDVQHWNKLVFPTIFLVHDTLPNLETSKGPYEVLVQVDPNVVNNPRQLVADKLNVLGYTLENGSPIGLSDLSAPEVTYSTICGDFDIAQIVGGMLIQPDSTAMFLAYGIANAIWLAPTMSGIGAGIYLTKNKWKR